MTAHSSLLLAAGRCRTVQPLQLFVPQTTWLVHVSTKITLPSLYWTQPAGAPLDLDFHW